MPVHGSMNADRPIEFRSQSICLNDLADLLKTVDENTLVAITDSNGLITHVNEMFCRVSKYDQHELIGQNHRVLNSGCHAEAFWRNLWQTILSGRVWKGQIKNRAKDGATFWVEATIAPTFDASGRLKHFLAVYSEISLQKEAEEILRQAQRLDSLRLMAGGIAHDFNNLLTSILGNCGIAGLNLAGDSPALPYLNKIEQTVQRAALLTNQLLAFTGRGPWLPILLELNTFVRDMEATVEAAVPRGVHVHLDLTESLLHVRADPSQLHQIIMSLTNNAAEAIGEDRDGAILLRLGAGSLDDQEAAALLPQTQVKAGPYAVLEVVDSGCGMAPELLSRIFDPFFTTKFTGRGLGLSAVLGILRAWDGGIAVESSPGGGSTFRVFLPLADPAAAAPRADRPSPPGAHRGTVLFVDDEPMLRECGAEVLASAGFEVLQAKDGIEALEAYRARAADITVVVMDLTMPRLGGLEAAAQLRALNPLARVILSSGYSDPVLAGPPGSLKPEAFLQKPYTLEALREIVLRVQQAGR